MWFIRMIQALGKKDFKELVSLMTITTSFLFFFMVFIVPIFIFVPDSSLRFADIILGYLMGSILPLVLKHYFEKKNKLSKEESKKDGE